MARPIWSGTISFGLVSVPVRMYSATQSKELRFHFLDRRDLTPIGYEKVRKDTGESVPSDEIVRGFEVEKGQFVPIEDEDLDRLDIELTHSVDICDFVSLEEIDPIYFRKAYYLLPQEGAEKPYRLLERALEETGKVGVAKVVAHTDPLARGMMWGLSLAHTPGHTFRAIIEGICYGTEHILRTMRARDFEPRITVVSGGPTKNGLWMQIHADVSNLPISFTRVKEGSVLGSAMLAAVGAGIYPDIPTASDNMVHTEKTIYPNPEAHEAYNFYVDRYIETYPRMRELMHEMTRHEAKRDRALADA